MYKYLKKIIVMLLVFLLGIDCFAAIISDNDGAALLQKKNLKH